MKIISYTSREANIFLSVKELNILKKSIIEVEKIISLHEFNLRLEVSPTRIDEFFQLINKLIEQEKSKKIIKQQFSFQEIIIINNILNEICNGNKNHDFDAKIGASFEEVDHLSLLISKLGKRMYLI